MGWEALTPVQRSGSYLEQYMGLRALVVDRMRVAKRALSDIFSS